MRKIGMAAVVLAATATTTTYAAVGAEEAKQLGTTLTIWGAEKAGNKDGTIPAYTGEKIPIPACYNPKQPGNYCDPWNDKPLFSITAQNMAQHADKLTTGQKEMLKKYPDYRMNVYPTRRTMVYPKYVLDNTVKNATACKGKENELVLEGCYGGLPFPIPKTGNQVMWNHVLKFADFSHVGKVRSVFVDAQGRRINQGEHSVEANSPYYNPATTTPRSTSSQFYRVRLDTFGPARRAGEKILVIQNLDPINTGNRAYQYLPGQRRVKLAPDLAYDTPSPVSGGGSTMDEQNLFFGAQDRYDFKLIGKRETFIVYNNFAASDYRRCPEEVYFTKNYPNPDCIRWELHRTWHIHATLKPGYRHILPIRDFYFDEDELGSGTADGFDAAGKLYRVNDQVSFPFYDVGYGVAADNFNAMNLQTGAWTLNSFGAIPGGGYGYHPINELKSENFWSPDALAGEGIR